MAFALILFILLVITGVLWVADVLVYAKARRAKGETDPVWVEWGAGFFPVILVVFVLRSFIVEPFRIPSDSMVPTLVDGDFILVNKYTYGIRLPIINKKVIEVNLPQRGDVMVFRYPADPSVDYIKRVVGLPGDKVEYQNKRLSINGVPVKMGQMEDFAYKYHLVKQFSEQLGENEEHRIINEKDAPSYIASAGRFPYRENCFYNSAGVICSVPQGHYFVMGDNRDNSLDSRYWGFVPEENIVGKAFFIWLNFSEPSRIGSFK